MKKLALFILEETKERKEEQKHDDKQLYRDNVQNSYTETMVINVFHMYLE